MKRVVNAEGKGRGEVIGGHCIVLDPENPRPTMTGGFKGPRRMVFSGVLC